MMLVSVYGNTDAPAVLFDLLKEREPHQNISHKAMPTWEEHVRFIESKPYPHWYLVQEAGQYVGSIYLTDKREVGLHIFKAHQRKGLGLQAMGSLQIVHPGPLLANIAPYNTSSQRFFYQLGFKMIQHTYAWEPRP